MIACEDREEFAPVRAAFGRARRASLPMVLLRHLSTAVFTRRARSQRRLKTVQLP